MTTEHEKELNRERVARYRQKQIGKKEQNKNVEPEQPTETNPLTDLLPEQPKKGSYKETHKNEYCERCGHHKFYCTCEEKPKLYEFLRIWDRDD